ncbi:hypothetical protein L1887_28515 [Cichorium endivia]|nr:hypothetical protein L1887_28515 [Cichorium endivia]
MILYLSISFTVTVVSESLEKHKYIAILGKGFKYIAIISEEPIPNFRSDPGISILPLFDLEALRIKRALPVARIVLSGKSSNREMHEGLRGIFGCR